MPQPQTLKEIGAEFDHLFVKKGGKNGKNLYFKEGPELIKEFCLTKLTYFAESMRMEKEKPMSIDDINGLIVNDSGWITERQKRILKAWEEIRIYGKNDVISTVNTKLDNFLKGGGV